MDPKSEFKNQSCCTKIVQITIGDIKHLSSHVGLSMQTFFNKNIVLDKKYNIFTLKKRNGKCLFWDRKNRKCSIFEAKPAYCRFISCIEQIQNDEMETTEAGTIEEQFRFYVSTKITSQYIYQYGLKYNKGGFKRSLKTIETESSDKSAMEEFSRNISKFRPPHFIDPENADN